MKVASIVVFRLAAFLGAAGLVYLLTAYEWSGGLLILLTAVAFTYLGVILRGAARQEGPAAQAGEATGAEAGVDEVHVGPTIWPFVFSLAGVALVLGVVVQRWWLILAGVAFVVAALGWTGDVRRSRRHAPH